MESPDELGPAFGAIRYPSLKDMLDRSQIDQEQVVKALDLVNQFAYGHRHAMLLPSERHDRLTLYKLVNLVRFLDLLPDVAVYEVGYRCPEQLCSYHQSLKVSIQRAYRRGIDRASLRIAEQAHERLWQVQQAVTHFYDGLS
ncbi:MAG: hypothetical protein IPN85_08550 [Flavobacteriales bacterium]|nr:hypothetical protein [Flavobacteriales bacterium]MBK9288492.1 hypothetical protein [Flavobacteriales bacterium]